ncbi:hypothetical protein Q765_04185 [Flavobacterium rivuli WB 3.3-2 = DSM 21788]|uniref:TMF family protein n=1 Tax=Flavobacterium rivuli WB 3.3-2 = DSM 21788 TaxID=1121895 RepID=A0A0A2MIW1_9FLAO|nr:hypothetical protein [Flavobacterium rivuli]KGO88240.1 hypothetical protein Q765_04185 [Flavobacterium rivuli WB 3.3-2 = DSM 21788]
MKTRLFLIAGLLSSVLIYGQSTTTSLGTSAGATGQDNVHIGKNAGSVNTGNQNTFVGSESGNSAGGSIYGNTFLGYRSGKFHSTGNYNVYLGYESGSGNTNSVKASNSVFIGYQAGQFSNLNVTPNSIENVFLGSQTAKNANGSYNNFIGRSAAANSTGSNNNYIGSDAGKNADGSNNIFLGSCGENVIGNLNILLGYHAGQNINGSNNILIGLDSGQGLGSTPLGSKNIIIGSEIGRTETGSNKLYIGHDGNPLISGEFKDSASGNIPASNPTLKFNAQKVGVGYVGSVGFGDFPAMTTIPNASIYRFFVKGGILAEEVRVRLQSGWADYVFANNYKLLSLKDTEKYIAANGHLPNMPSAAQVEDQGIEMGNIVKLQQEKIEELTLHLIEQNKQIEALKLQTTEIEVLRAQMQQLLKKQ